MKPVFALIAALLLAQCADPPAAPTPTPPPLPTPAPPYYAAGCPVASYASPDALLAALSGADYECAEGIAAALIPIAAATVTERLIAMASEGSHALARRNALRVIGRFGEAGGAAAAQLRADDALSRIVAGQLASEGNDGVVQDAIWIADTLLFPADALQPALARLSADRRRTAALRTRAAYAAGRLIVVRSTALSPADRNFLSAALASDLPGVRARAAEICALLSDTQLAGSRVQLLTALEAAWSVPDPPDPAAAAPSLPAPLTHAPYGISGEIEADVAPLAARSAVARAIDRLAPGEARYETLRAVVEAASLPHEIRSAGAFVRGGLPEAELRELVTIIEATRAAFFAIAGPRLREPIAGESDAQLSVMVFAERAAFQRYMQAFVGFGADDDGLYVEERATLYTYARTPGDSANTLEETLRHEVGHFLMARYVLPGGWTTPGYHNEPKGWIDEGMAEYLAGALGDGYFVRTRNLMSLCAAPAWPRLPDLLSRRAGYDQHGRFDYPAAWAFTSFLISRHQEGLQRLYAALRAETYRSADLPQLLGVSSIPALEVEWYVVMEEWCRR